MRLSEWVGTARGGQAEAVLTEDAVNAGSVVAPRGGVVSCRASGVVNGRLNLTCETLKAGERGWTFSGLALGDGDRAGLRVVDGGVASGTLFVVAVTESAMLE